MRNAGRLKLGYYPLPIEEAQNIRALLVPSGPYAAVDPCVGDGTALVEITKDTGAHLAGIELDADRAAAAADKGIATVHGSAFECRVLAETCSLLYLNPPYSWASRRADEDPDEEKPDIPTLLRLKAEMAAAHPDKGGTSAAFIAARKAYVEARRRARAVP